MPTLSLYFPNEFPDPTMAGQTYRLVVPRPDGQSEYTIGRSPDLALTLAVKTISRRHCAISYSYAADRWSLYDLGSSGGTWLNGKRLESGHLAPLAVGDRIHLSSNPPLSVVEDENDTINEGEIAFRNFLDDDGPATVASTTPLATLPPEPKPSPDGYDDALYLAVQWLTGGTTLLGKAARFLLAVLLVATTTIVLGLLLFE